MAWSSPTLMGNGEARHLPETRHRPHAPPPRAGLVAGSEFAAACVGSPSASCVSASRSFHGRPHKPSPLTSCTTTLAPLASGLV